MFDSSTGSAILLRNDNWVGFIRSNSYATRQKMIKTMRYDPRALMLT